MKNVVELLMSNFTCRVYCNRFDGIVKPEEFYEEHAESNPRRYFYNVDLQGRLFLGQSANFAWQTCIYH